MGKAKLIAKILLISAYLIIVSLPAGAMLTSFTTTPRSLEGGGGGQSLIDSAPRSDPPTPSPEAPTPTPTSAPAPTPTPVSEPEPPPTSEPNRESFLGQSVQIDDVTWRTTVKDIEPMATPWEIFVALNDYRSRHGSPSLQWDDRLAGFAQQRATNQNNSGGFDKHVGFEAFVADESNFTKIGFLGLGENVSEHQLSGVHLIEWVFGADEPHDQQQLDPSWTHTGVGVSGTISVLIFGKGAI